jgi:tetratricopeptide (TPR) repeat protein
MFFECRAAPPAVSEPFIPCAELFQAGKTRAAAREALALAAAGEEPRLAADVLLLADLARASGLPRRAEAWLRWGQRHFPGERRLTFALLYEKIGRQPLSRSLGQIDFLAASSEGGDGGVAEALRSLVWARHGFVRRAVEHRERTLRTGLRLPFVVYLLTEVELELHRFEEAAELGQRLAQQVPRWARARLLLAEALLGRTRSEEGLRALWEPLQQGTEDAGLELRTGWLAFHLGDHAAAFDLLWRRVKGWPEAEGAAALMRRLENLPWRLERTPDALPELLAEAPALAETLAGELEGRHLLAHPLISWRRGPGLAAAVTMVTAAQGVAAEPRMLVEALAGREEMPLWRLADLVAERHFRVELVNTSSEVLCSLIDQGVALIGERESWPRPRLEVVKGYDLGRRLFLLARPDDPAPEVVSFEEVPARYASSGGLIALVAPLRAFEVALLPGSRSLPMALEAEIERACALGERERAEKAVRALGARRPTALRRELAIRAVLRGPRESAAAIAALLAEPRQSPAARLRAAAELRDAEFLAGVRPFLRPEEPVPGIGRRVPALFEAWADRDWPRLLAVAGQLAERCPELEIFWTAKALAAACLGYSEIAREAAQLAVELAPEAFEAQALLRLLRASPRPALEEIGELRRVVEQNPHRHRLKLELVRELARQGDGLLFEKALLETLRFLPRWPPAWHLLAEWYAGQRRADLAQGALDRAAGWLAPAELEIRPGDAGLPDFWAEASAAGRLFAARELAAGEEAAPPQLPAEGPRQLVWRAFLVAARPLELPAGRAAGLLQALETELEGEQPQPLLEVLRGELEESVGEVRSALGRYERLLREVPSLGLAWQRLGRLLEERGENEAALEAYRRALGSQPALGESLEGLARLERGFGHQEGELRARDAFCRLKPYAFAPLEKLVLALLEYRGLPEALAAIEERRSQHDASNLAALRARVRAEAGDFVGAEEELLRRPEAREAQPLHATIAELLAAEARADEVKAAVLIEVGLRLAPDNAHLLLARARELERREPAGLEAFYRQALLAGTPDPRLLRGFLRGRGSAPARAARELLEAAPERRRKELALALAEVLPEMAPPEETRGFLAFAVELLPWLVPLLSLYAQSLLAAGRRDDAVAIARRLYELEPESPRWIALLADCLRETAPREAHQFLLKEYEKTGALDCLVEIAGSYLRLGEAGQATATYHRVLEEAPENPVALVRLFELGERPHELFDGLYALVARGRGFDSRNLHVAAVEVAIAVQRSLPEAWLEGAQRRFEQLRRALEEAGEERLRLGLAIAKWLQVYGRKDEAKAYRLAAGSTWRRLRLLDWPASRRWIAPPPGDTDDDTVPR